MLIKQQFDFSLLSSFPKKVCLLICCSLLALGVQAQGNMDKAKLDIWTETASFVYRDAKMAEPRHIVNAKTMDEFVAAIKKADSESSIYSKLYRPIEQSGEYRKGANAKAQLDLLIKAIYNRLRENEQRMADLARRRRLDDLNKQLQQIASDYSQPQPEAAAPKGDESFTAPDNTEVQLPPAEENAYAENQLSSLSKKQGASKETDWISIAALIMALLNLILFYMLYKRISRVQARIDRRKKDVDDLSLQVDELKASGGNTPVDQADIERLVQLAVAKHLSQKSQNVRHAATPAPTPTPTPEAAEPESIAPQPPAQEVSPPASPAAETPVPTPPAPAPQPEKPVSFFARVPVNGGFHEQDLHPSPQHDSIYEIRVSRKDPNKAAFRIVPNPAVHRSAIESAYLSLKDACNYQMNNQHATHIITDEPGTLTFQNGFWVIDRKAQIHFE